MVLSIDGGEEVEVMSFRREVGEEGEGGEEVEEVRMEVVEGGEEMEVVEAIVALFFALLSNTNTET